MAGGVALNCVMNARLRDAAPFDDVWVQPAAGDAGTALGAALWIDYRERAQARRPSAARWRMDHAYLGPGYRRRRDRAFLHWSQAAVPARSTNIADETADLLARGPR